MTNRSIRRTRQVGDDVVAIYRYIHARSEQSADKVFDAIEKSVRSLLDAPGVGRHWNSPDPRLEGMRVTTVRPYRNYLIFFRTVPDGIEVFRIVHAARSLQPLVDEIVIDFEDRE
ncbi:MAG: type II toxin-antitoxin system RelE/ParE family toxin [Tepidisphaeraceae bacterium]